MRRDDPSFRLVVAAARGLGDLVGDFVFLGGATTNLLLTDPAAPAVRPTLDVDIVVEMATVLDYLRLESELDRRGFVSDETPGAPRCRRVFGHVRIDVMPTDASILGFTNRWYPAVCATATAVELEPGMSIRLVTPALFLATKVEAFRGRGGGDLFGSHDLEDIVAVIDGRPELVAEISASSSDTRSYLAEALRDLLAQPRFRDAVQGHLPADPVSQVRSQIVLDRFRQICRAGERT